MEKRFNTVLTAAAGLKIRLLLVVAGLACALMVSALIQPADLPPPAIDGAELASVQKGEQRKNSTEPSELCPNCEVSIKITCSDTECGWWYGLWNDCCESGDDTYDIECKRCR